MIFKIRAKINGTIFQGAYLGDEQKFTFGRQNSGYKGDNFTLYTGTLVDMEFDSVRFFPEPGSVLNVDGHFIDFSKKQIPEPVFCVTRINVI